jgi:hypothetical protein
MGELGSSNGRDDLPASELHDLIDRDELRSRYYGLLQELRVLLPGAQILVAFFLTAPFSSRFGELDEFGRLLYGFALATGMVSIVAFASPIAFHRVGQRRARSRRLIWSIACTRVGLLFLALSLTSAVTMVNRFVFNGAVALFASLSMVVLLATAWLILPFQAGRHPSHFDPDGPDGPAPPTD